MQTTDNLCQLSTKNKIKVAILHMLLWTELYFNYLKIPQSRTVEYTYLDLSRPMSARHLNNIM